MDRSIDVVLLCAGYGTRLRKDLIKDSSSAYSHLIDVPKPLLPVGDKPLIGYWLEEFEKSSYMSKVLVVTNEAHKISYEKFLKNASTVKEKIPICIVSDLSTSNETRTGAVSCMRLGIQETDKDVLILAGDTLFSSTFSLNQMVTKFHQLQADHENVCLIVSAPVAEANITKHGIIEVEDNGRVTSFLEKPQAHETNSRLQSPCCYLMSKKALVFIDEFLELMKNEPLSKKDATGNLMVFLLEKIPVFAFAVTRRFDIGNLESYLECCREFESGSCG